MILDYILYNFLRILFFIYSYLRNLYKIRLILFQESFTYPKDVDLSFFGCDPVIIREKDNNRVFGLPKLVTDTVLGFENQCDNKIITFSQSDGLIPWKKIFEDLSKITFYEDLD